MNQAVAKGCNHLIFMLHFRHFMTHKKIVGETYVDGWPVSHPGQFEVSSPHHMMRAEGLGRDGSMTKSWAREPSSYRQHDS